MPPKSKAAKAKDAKAKAAKSASASTPASTAAAPAAADDFTDDSSSSSSNATASTTEKPQVKESYRNCTGVLISQPRALDVKIGGFTLAAYGKELIKDTQIEFTIGRRYGLIGSNGSGKSAFLKCLAEREVPIPPHIDIFLLEEEVAAEEKTPTEVVIYEVQEEMKRLEAESERILEEEGPESELLQDIYNRLDGMDPSTFEVRAGKLLHGLGFSQDFMQKKTKDLSGGWRMRVALAKALFIKPTLLLLDEPTNHLDLEACVWLENYLATYDRCLVVISHSQDFLNGVSTPRHTHTRLPIDSPQPTICSESHIVCCIHCCLCASAGMHQHHSHHREEQAEELHGQLRHVHSDQGRAGGESDEEVPEGAGRHQAHQGLHRLVRHVQQPRATGQVQAEDHRQDGGGRADREGGAASCVQLPLH